MTTNSKSESVVDARCCLESALDYILEARKDPDGLLECAGVLERILVECKGLCEIALKSTWRD